MNLVNLYDGENTDVFCVILLLGGGGGEAVFLLLHVGYIQEALSI